MLMEEIVCGSLADGENRGIRQDDYCECKEGWTGINCNVCTENKACNALMPGKEGGVCYQNGEVVNENYQMCDVTNKKIVDILEGRRPQVTFTCNANDTTCAFQCKWESRESTACLLTVTSSLGRAQGILLLRSEYLQFEHRQRLRPKLYQLQV
jgi:hypothetical protein